MQVQILKKRIEESKKFFVRPSMVMSMKPSSGSQGTRENIPNQFEDEDDIELIKSIDFYEHNISDERETLSYLKKKAMTEYA